MDDPLAGLEELVSSTLAVVGAPAVNPLVEKAPALSGAPSASDPYAGYSSLDLGPLEASPAKDASSILSPLQGSASGSPAGGLADIDLLGAPSQPLGSAAQDTYGSMSPTNDALGAAFSIDLQQDVPLKHSVLSSAAPAPAPAAQPTSILSDPLASIGSTDRDDDDDLFGSHRSVGAAAASASASASAGGGGLPSRRSGAGAGLPSGDSPLAAYPSQGSSTSFSSPSHHAGSTSHGSGAGTSAGFQVLPQQPGGAALRMSSTGGASTVSPDEEHPVKVCGGSCAC